jgi:hypothetical protein
MAFVFVWGQMLIAEEKDTIVKAHMDLTNFASVSFEHLLSSIEKYLLISD